MTNSRILLVFSVLLLEMIPACSGTSAAGLPITKVRIGKHTVTAELAQSAGERARGLMYRKELGKNDGMLFVFPDEEIRSFWMKNTLIPLSIAYIDSDFVIVRIVDMNPQTTDGHGSSKPVRYALEVNRGWFRDHGVREGAKVEFALPKEESK